MRTTTIITTMSLLILSACVPLPDGGQDTETIGWGSTGPDLPEGLWLECHVDPDCSTHAEDLNCVAGAELELGPDGEWVIGQHGAFCTVGCSDEIPCPMGPQGQIAACLTFPSQPGVGWCYLRCDDAVCPEDLTCMDLQYSLQEAGDHHYCV